MDFSKPTIDMAFAFTDCALYDPAGSEFAWGCNRHSIQGSFGHKNSAVTDGVWTTGIHWTHFCTCVALDTLIEMK